jgi:3-methyladenine DNA glycosylase AlkD
MSTERETPDQLHQALRKELEQYAEEQDAVFRIKLPYEIATGGEVLGVRTEIIEQVVTHFHLSRPRLTAARVMRVAERALGKEQPGTRDAMVGCREEIMASLMLLGRLTDSFPPSLWTHATAWIKRIDNWEATDALAAYVIAPLILAEPQRIQQLFAWSRGLRLWERRLAVTSATRLLAIDTSHIIPALTLAEEVITDPEPLVIDAVEYLFRVAGSYDQEVTWWRLRKLREVAPQRVLQRAGALLSIEQQAFLLEH